MAADFTPLANEVGGLTSVVDSAVALLDGFESRLQAAIEADNVSDNSNVGQFAKSFSAEKTRLAEAVTRNTPAAPDTGGDTGGGETGGGETGGGEASSRGR